MYHFAYESIPSAHRVGTRPDEQVTLYRGDTIQATSAGVILPKLPRITQAEREQLLGVLTVDSPLREILTTGGTDAVINAVSAGKSSLIAQIIHHHTRYGRITPLFSTTSDREVAQRYAAKHNETVIKLRIAVNRILRV